MFHNFLLIAVSLSASAALAADPPKPVPKEKEPPSERALAGWVKQLGDASFEVREAAGRALVEAGPHAMAAVREAAKGSKDAEVKRRAADTAKEIEAHTAKVFEGFGADVQRRDDGTVRVVVFRVDKPSRFADTDAFQLLGLPALDHLCLSGTKISDDGLKMVGRADRLKFLDLGHTCVTDAGLAHLKSLDRLETLLLDFTQVTGSGLAHLNTLKSLRFLSLLGCKATDKGLQTGVPGLKELKGLKEIILSKTELTDAGLEYLGTLKALTYLRLSDTKVTGVGLTHLKALPLLENLDLIRTRLTDEGCGRLAELKELQAVSLDNTAVSIDGLKKLGNLPKLKRLFVKEVNLTRIEVEELRKAVPAVMIEGLPTD